MILTNGELTLEARADAANVLQNRQLLEACVRSDTVMRRDNNDTDEQFDLDVRTAIVLPREDELKDDPVARPVSSSQIVTWAVGDDHDSAGWRELEVHRSGAL